MKPLDNSAKMRIIAQNAAKQKKKKKKNHADRDF